MKATAIGLPRAGDAFGKRDSVCAPMEATTPEQDIVAGHQNPPQVQLQLQCQHLCPQQMTVFACPIVAYPTMKATVIGSAKAEAVCGKVVDVCVLEEDITPKLDTAAGLRSRGPCLQAPVTVYVFPTAACLMIKAAVIGLPRAGAVYGKAANVCALLEGITPKQDTAAGPVLRPVLRHRLCPTPST